jgi:endonuclease-3
MLVAEMNGEVPREFERLLTLPGVARKTANVVLGTGYGIAEGVVVDTHVGRISHRLGLTRHSDPKKVEQDLMKRLPRGHWIRFAHQMIDHGRAICLARKPRCESCFLADLCAYAPLGLPRKRLKKSAPRPDSRRPRRSAKRSV